MTSEAGTYIAVGIVIAMVGDMMFYDNRVGVSVQEVNTYPSCFVIIMLAGQSCVLNRKEGVWFPEILKVVVPVGTSFLKLVVVVVVEESEPRIEGGLKPTGDGKPDYTVD